MKLELNLINLMIYLKKFNESYSDNSISLESLKKKYPNAIISMNPLDKFPGNFFASWYKNAKW